MSWCGCLGCRCGFLGRLPSRFWPQFGEISHSEEFFDPVLNELRRCLGGVLSVQTSVGQLFQIIANLNRRTQRDLNRLQTVLGASHELLGEIMP